MVGTGGVEAVAVGEGSGGSLLVEQAAVISSTVMIARVTNVADRVASLSRNCCGTKLFSLPAAAIRSASLRAGFIELLAMTGGGIKNCFRTSSSPSPQPSPAGRGR